MTLHDTAALVQAATPGADHVACWGVWSNAPKVDWFSHQLINLNKANDLSTCIGTGRSAYNPSISDCICANSFAHGPALGLVSMQTRRD